MISLNFSLDDISILDYNKTPHVKFGSPDIYAKTAVTKGHSM
jgi:hypothetical protein